MGMSARVRQFEFGCFYHSCMMNSTTFNYRKHWEWWNWDFGISTRVSWQYSNGTHRQAVFIDGSIKSDLRTWAEHTWTVLWPADDTAQFALLYLVLVIKCSLPTALQYDSTFTETISPIWMGNQKVTKPYARAKSKSAFLFAQSLLADPPHCEKCNCL